MSRQGGEGSRHEQLLQQELEATKARAAREIAALVAELERKNRELEAFTYSVSHDLRAPLRAVDGFSQALLEDYGDELDEGARHFLSRVRAAARRMGELIDDLLALSRVGRAELRRQPTDLSALARAVSAELQRAMPERSVAIAIQDGLLAEVDPKLFRVVIESLLDNAWKFTAKAATATVELSAADVDGERVYRVRDNGVGFDSAHAGMLFTPFQRLHSESEFPGTGIGLATVQRIVDRHGGRVWAEGSVGAGATFFWTLPVSTGGGTE